jgi:apolipoprotein N-acyltransferase
MNPSYWWAGYLAVVALCLLSAIPYFLFGVLSDRCRFFEHNNPHPLAAAALLSLIVELWPAKFPGSLANALYANSLFIQIAELGGMPLVHTVLHGIGFSLAAALCASRAHCFRHLALSGALLVGSFGFGHYRISNFDPTPNQSATLSVAMIQPNIHLAQSTCGMARNTDLLFALQ